MQSLPNLPALYIAFDALARSDVTHTSTWVVGRRWQGDFIRDYTLSLLQYRFRKSVCAIHLGYFGFSADFSLQSFHPTHSYWQDSEARRRQLSDGAKLLDKGDLTQAGRALQKHGGRIGSAFPPVKGNTAAINEQGQSIVDGILNDESKKVLFSNTGRFGQVTDIIATDGRGLRYDPQGKLIGFLEPPKWVN